MPSNIAFLTTNLVRFWSFLKSILKTLTRPLINKKSSNSITDLARSRKNLLLENAFLRQQLAILARQVERPKITRRDRLKLLLLARFLPDWKSLLQIVQPATLLRWHRDLFKTFWKQKSGPKTHPRRISDELIALIRQMAEENKLWGAERIRGELLKLGMCGQAHDPEILAEGPLEARTSLGDFPAEPCAGYLRMRFYGCA